jgi:hypothetical protein
LKPILRRGVRDDWQMTAERQRLIAEALGRKPQTILEIDVGYDLEVAIVDDDWVFRFPRRPGAEEALKLETLVLPALAPSLPVLVPSFEYVSHNPLFVGYRVIRGEPLVDEDGEGVRAFLDALHAFDTSGLPVAAEDWVEAYRNQCLEFERLVFPVLDSNRRTRARRLFGDVETQSVAEPRGRAEVILAVGRTRVELFDWGDADIWGRKRRPARLRTCARSRRRPSRRALPAPRVRRRSARAETAVGCAGRGRRSDCGDLRPGDARRSRAPA